MSKSRKRLTKRWSEPAPGAYLHFKATRQAQSPRRGDAVIRVYDDAGNVIARTRKKISENGLGFWESFP